MCAKKKTKALINDLRLYFTVRVSRQWVILSKLLTGMRIKPDCVPRKYFQDSTARNRLLSEKVAFVRRVRIISLLRCVPMRGWTVFYFWSEGFTLFGVVHYLISSQLSATPLPASPQKQVYSSHPTPILNSNDSKSPPGKWNFNENNFCPPLG